MNSKLYILEFRKNSTFETFWLSFSSIKNIHVTYLYTETNYNAMIKRNTS